MENKFAIISEQRFNTYIPQLVFIRESPKDKARVIHDTASQQYNYNNSATGLAIGIAIGSMFQY